MLKQRNCCVNILFWMLVILSILLLTSCSLPEDYHNSMSVKEFLNETKCVLIVDNQKITKYTPMEDINIDCSEPTLIALEAENGGVMSEFLYVPKIHDGKWIKLPNVEVQMKIFSVS